MLEAENPKLVVNPGNSIKEPKSRLYRIWVELYDMVKCQVISPGAPVHCVISCAQFKSEPQKAKWKKEKKVWKWPITVVEPLNEKGMIFPEDLT